MNHGNMSIQPESNGDLSAATRDHLLYHSLEAQEETQEKAPELPLTLRMRANKFNYVITSLGNVSTGLLSTLITNDNLKKTNLPLWGTIMIDVIVFTTTVACNVAIVLYFNQRDFISAFNKVYNSKLPDFFKCSTRDTAGNIGWLLTCLLSLNISAFWTALVAMAFTESANLLEESSSERVIQIGNQLRKPYLYAPFMFCAFFTNLTGWPNLFFSAYSQKKHLLQWLCKNSDEKNDSITHAATIHSAWNSLLSDLKEAIENDNSECKSTDQLFSPFPDYNANALLPAKLTFIKELALPELQQALLVAEYTHPFQPSTKAVALKHGAAILLSAVTAAGFYNVFGLAMLMWDQYSINPTAASISATLIYHTMIEVACITVYPTVCYAFDIIQSYKMPVYAFSFKTLSAIVTITLFTSLFGGLANAEQSALDNEPSNLIVNATIAATLLNSITIYEVFKHYIENNIRITPESNNTDTPTKWAKFLDIQEREEELQNSVESYRP